MFLKCEGRFEARPFASSLLILMKKLLLYLFKFSFLLQVFSAKVQEVLYDRMALLVETFHKLPCHLFYKFFRLTESLKLDILYYLLKFYVYFGGLLFAFVSIYFIAFKVFEVMAHLRVSNTIRCEFLE